METVLLATADGLALEGDAFIPTDPWAAAVVAHPHPLYGGDRHNLVVEALVRGLLEAGVATVRFDFRGVGRSEGEHDGGEAERLDIVAALDVAAPFAGDTGPLLLAGYSFGALVALNVTDPRLSGWLAVAPPLVAGSGAPLAATDHRPKLLLVAEHDQFAPPATVLEQVADWRTTTVETVPQADHFLAGATRHLATRAAELVHELVVPER